MQMLQPQDFVGNFFLKDLKKNRRNWLIQLLDRTPKQKTSEA